MNFILRRSIHDSQPQNPNSFVSCSVRLDNFIYCVWGGKGAIIGRWQQAGGGTQILEFFQADTVTVTSQGITLTGTCKWLDEKTIQITTPGLFGSNSQVYDVTISGEKLSLSSSGVTIDFNRIQT